VGRARRGEGGSNTAGVQQEESFRCQGPPDGRTMLHPTMGPTVYAGLNTFEKQTRLSPIYAQSLIRC
jgi:hypothetical protein